MVKSWNSYNIQVKKLEYIYDKVTRYLKWEPTAVTISRVCMHKIYSESKRKSLLFHKIYEANELNDRLEMKNGLSGFTKIPWKLYHAYSKVCCCIKRYRVYRLKRHKTQRSPLLCLCNKKQILLRAMKPKSVLARCSQMQWFFSKSLIMSLMTKLQRSENKTTGYSADDLLMFSVWWPM